MAVVQISKIQVRRGRKSQTNLPQLAGGEFGWAVDSQQLFIGNGSVSEGAPYVGNTEVLTEKSNIFDLLGAYTYKGYLLDNNGNSVVQTGSNSNTPFARSLQNKLDDFVNVRDFGAQGDYSNGVGTDDTAAIQRAINQVFLNSANKSSERSRRTVYFPAGVYKITGPIFISSYVNIIGDGLDKTVFLQDSDTQNMLRTIAFTSTPTNYVQLANMNSNNAPTNVYIRGVTFKRNPGSVNATAIAVLDCLQNSTFENCRFIGAWNNGNGEERSPQVIGTNTGVVVRGLGTVTSENINFIGCEFEHFVQAVYSDYDSYRVNFRNCKFKFLYRALSLAKGSTQTAGKSLAPQSYLVMNSLFDKIDAEAWIVYDTTASKGHRSFNNRYLDVGNNSFEQSQPVTPVIDFRVEGCESIDDYFQRNEFVNSIDIHKPKILTSMVAYLPDVLGVGQVTYPTKSTTLFFNTPDVNPKILLKTPAWSTSKVIVDYSIRKAAGNLYRSGKLTITIHPDMSALNSPIVPLIIDDFTYYGSNDTIGSSLGGNVKFYASVVNLTAVEYNLVNNAFIPSTVYKPTLVLRYTNPSGPGGNATITYKVTILSGEKEF